MTSGPCDRRDETACLMEIYQRDHERAQAHEEIERAYAMHGLAHEARMAIRAPGEHVPARAPRELERLVFFAAVVEAVDDPVRAHLWRAVHEELVATQGRPEFATTEARRALVTAQA